MNLKNILKTDTLRQSLITFTGTSTNGILGALFYIYLARLLGPSAFGIFSVAIVTLALITDVTNLGTTTGIVNFVSRYAKSDPKKSDQFLKLALKIKLIISALVLIVGNISAPYIANIVFSKPELEFPLRLVFIGVGTSHLFSFALSTLQAYQKFVVWSGLQIFTNALRLMSVFLITYFWSLDITNSLLVYLLYPFIGFLLVFIFIPRTFISANDENKRFNDFIGYNKWVASFAIVSAISSRLDTFITARLLDSFQIGLYSAANQLVQVVPQIVGAIGAVIAPKIASIKNKSDLIVYLKKTQLMVLGVAFLGLVSVPIAIYFIPILFGDLYLASSNIFIILMIAMLTFLISVPIHQTVLHYFEYPKLFSWLAIVNLVITSVVGWAMISTYGVVGAAITVLFVQCINFIIPLAWVFNKLKKM